MRESNIQQRGQYRRSCAEHLQQLYEDQRGVWLDYPTYPLPTPYPVIPLGGDEPRAAPSPAAPKLWSRPHGYPGA